jgi:hypothetical protein
VIYSHKWLSAIDTDELYALALDEWTMRLAGLTRAEIRNGIANLPSGWPPSSIEFKELCVGDDKHNTGAYKPFDKSRAIEQKPNKEIARAGMAEAKAMLGVTV